MAERKRKTHIRVPSVEGQLGYPPDPVKASEAWQCSHARAVEERVERVITGLEAQRDEALMEARRVLWAPARSALRARASGLATAIEALRGGEDG